MKIQSMFAPLDIASSGLKAHSKQLQVVASNIANAQTTNNGNGEAYRKLFATLEATDDDSISGVEIGEIFPDKRDFTKILDPGHPDADENGYVSMPNVNYAQEMINLNLASRAYQANAAMLKRYQNMVNSSLELLK